MTTTTLTENCQVIHRTTYRLLTPDDIADKDETDVQEQFVTRVYERLGSWVLPRKLEDIGLENTPQYDLYEDETQNKQMFSQLTEKLQPMPEVKDHYIGTEILLPRGDDMTRGNVGAYSHDANGNVMGRAHTYPILDTRMYQVEFAGGNITELTTFFTAEWMYVQCDADRNEYLLLGVLVDFCKDNKAVSFKEQQVSILGRPITWKTTAGWHIYCQWKDGSTL